MPSSLMYTPAKVKFGQAVFNWGGAGTYKIMLVNGYTPAATHASRADVTSEVTGTGYTAGGATLSGLSITQDNTNARAQYNANNPSWASSSITATGAVIYQSNGGASTGDPILCYLDFGGTVTSTANTFTVQFSTSGVFDN